MKCPCKDCQDRKLLCHGQCDQYQAWKKENEAMRKWLNDSNVVQVSDAVIRKRWKNSTVQRRKHAVNK